MGIRRAEASGRKRGCLVKKLSRNRGWRLDDIDHRQHVPALTATDKATPARNPYRPPMQITEPRDEAPSGPGPWPSSSPTSPGAPGCGSAIRPP